MAYAEKRAANPGALGLTIGLNLAAVVAIAAWNPNITRIIIGSIPSYPIGPQPLPPPSVEDPKPQTKPHIDHPKTAVPVAGPVEQWRPTDPDPRPLVFNTGGGETGTTIIPDPPQPPIRQVVKRGVAMATSPGELQPPYPPALQRGEIQGSVTVRVLVGPDGRPRDIVLVRADDPGFFTAAKTWGLRHWRFKPASEDGSPVDSWYTLTVRFTIN
ncbi:hypothetical protein SPAN111604_02335 [Sphingomonas antarctica]|uniref:energy transducer TonB n=1 Tax=Sphingomonas antarctica TaxID=2040274 RepID=UPI0039EC43C8